MKKCNVSGLDVAELRHILGKGVCLFMFEKLKKRYENRKWKMYLFYNGILIGKVKINDANEINTVYLRVIGHKALFGSNNVGIMVKPIKLLKTDEERKITYWGTTFEKGVDM